MKSNHLSTGLLFSLIDIACPQCGYVFEVQMLDATCQVTRMCPCCRVRIRLSEGTGDVSGAMREIDAQTDSLQRQLDRMFR
jgi:hypothetical protein